LLNYAKTVVSRQQFSQQEKASKETMKKKVLFICVQNSARSQIGAALLNEMCADHFDAHSAGLEPGVLNPLAGYFTSSNSPGFHVLSNQGSSEP
jgi:hypothetical protein